MKSPFRRSCLLLLLCFGLDAVSGGTSETEKKKLLITSDYGSLTSYSNSRTREDMDRILDVFRSARPDIVAIDAANPDGCNYRTRVGFYRANDSLDALYASGIDPYAHAVDSLRAAGIRVLAGVRMNDHHGQLHNWGPWSRAHPQWSLGPEIKQNPDLPNKDPESMTWRELGAMRRMDYAIPEVRAHRLAIIEEILDLFEVDGLQLDFNRLPPFLSSPREQNALHLTAYLREIRALLDARAAAARRPMLLGAIVPWDIAFCRAEGLDVDAWAAENLVDYLAPGEWYYADWNIEIEPWTRLAEGRPLEIYPLVCGNVSQTARHHSGHRPMLGDNRRLDGAKISAFAENYYAQGADGILFYNFYAQGHAGRFYPALRGLTDPRLIPHLPRHYYFHRPLRYVPLEVYTFGSALLGRSAEGFIRFPLAAAGERCRHTFRFHSEPQDRQQAFFGFKIGNHYPEDLLAVTLNGTALEAGRINRFEARDPYDGTAFPVAQWHAAVGAPPLENGLNSVEITLVEAAAGRAEPLLIGEFEIWVPGTSESRTPFFHP